MFNKVNKNEYKLPGGGIENDESLEETFKREIKEETGCVVKIVERLGKIEEEKRKDNFKQTSYVYVAKVVRNTKKLNLTEKEKDEGGKLIWVTLDEGLKLISDCINNLKPSKYENLYHSKFIVLRDKKILEYYIKERKGENDGK